MERDEVCSKRVIAIEGAASRCWKDESSKLVIQGYFQFTNFSKDEGNQLVLYSADK